MPSSISLDGQWPSLTPSTLPGESHCVTNMFAQPKDKKGFNGEGTCYRKQTQTIPRTKQWEAHRDTAQKPSPDLIYRSRAIHTLQNVPQLPAEDATDYQRQAQPPFPTKAEA